MSISKSSRGYRAVDSVKVKLLSRTKVYSGKTFRDFTCRFEVNGVPVLFTITKAEGMDMIYPVKGANEKKSGEQLYVIYGRVTELSGKGGRRV